MSIIVIIISAISNQIFFFIFLFCEMKSHIRSHRTNTFSQYIRLHTTENDQCRQTEIKTHERSSHSMRRKYRVRAIANIQIIQSRRTTPHTHNSLRFLVGTNECVCVCDAHHFRAQYAVQVQFHGRRFLALMMICFFFLRLIWMMTKVNLVIYILSLCGFGPCCHNFEFEKSYIYVTFSIFQSCKIKIEYNYQIRL